jgi:diguanylate cyclase (GGDEF)-like protein
MTLDSVTETTETTETKNINEEIDRTSYWETYAKTHSPKEVGQMLAQKEEEADTDSLTGIYNRRGWVKQVEVFTSLADRKNEPISFCVIDIDDFKAINDIWGHAFGDTALKFVVQVAKESLRESDILARLGGDEFGILLPETDLSGADNVRNKVVAELKKSFDEMDADDALKAIELSVSIGVSTKHPTDSVDDVMFKADKDMYKVKGSKKNV